MQLSQIISLHMLLALCIAITGCEKAQEPNFNNPIDPMNPDYVSPEVIIISGPEEGAEVSNSKVIFQWEKSDLSIEYSYQLDDSDWSDWVKSYSYETPELDEGSHTFSVKGRYSGTNDESLYLTVRNFIIDAVKGPAIMIKPRQTQLSEDTSAVFQVMAEEMSDMMLAHIVLNYDPNIFTIEDLQPGDFLSNTGGSVLFFDNTSVPGRIEIDTGIGLSTPPGINGSGVIAQIKFKILKAAEGYIEINSESEIRDSNNDNIMIKELVGCLINIQ